MAKRRRSKRQKPARTTVNPALRATIMEVVDNQLRDNEPAETRQTYERLLGEGYSPEEARNLIGNIVVQEIYDVMKQGQPYDQARFVAKLLALPDSAV